MRYSIDGYPFTYLCVELSPGERITAEPGSFLMGMGEFKVETSTGGLIKGLKRLLGGESLFLNTYEAITNCTLVFAPSVPGEIIPLNLNGESWILNDRVYLAHYGNVDIDVQFLGLKGIFTRGNLFWLKVKGVGTVFICSYGRLLRIDVPPGQKILVDNNQLVGFPEGTSYNLRKFGGLKSFLFGGEGLVCEIYGPTTVLIQTRSLDQFASEISRFLTAEAKKEGIELPFGISIKI